MTNVDKSAARAAARAAREAAKFPPKMTESEKFIARFELQFRVAALCAQAEARRAADPNWINATCAVELNGWAVKDFFKNPGFYTAQFPGAVFMLGNLPDRR